MSYLEADDDIPEKIYVQPNWVSPHDRAFVKVRALEAELEKATADDRPQIEAELKAANAAWEIEKVRALDDRFRWFHLVSRWRANEGRDTYNASRRTRAKPNAAPKDMSGEERKTHRRAQIADSEWRRTKKAAGWTADQIEAGLEERRAKRK